MKQYFLNPQNIRRILLTGLKYGLMAGLITIVVRYFFMTNTDYIQGNILFILLSFVTLVVGEYLAFKYFNQKHQQRQVKFLPTLIVGLVFSICIGVMLGFTHYFDVTFEPTLTKQNIELSKNYWFNNYTPEIIDNQLEFVPNLKQPLLWALEMTLFFGVISFILSFMVTTFMKISEEMALVRS